MSKDIIFIVPALNKRMKDESIGTLILAKKAKLAGYKVGIVRYWNVSINPSEDYTSFACSFVKYVLSQKSTIVSFYCRCEEYHICIDLSLRIKKEDPNVIICFGGPQAELVAKETIRRFSFVDFVCCSEGEFTIIPLLDFLIKKDIRIDISNVAGLTYRDEAGNIIQNEFPKFLRNNYYRSNYYYDLIPIEILNETKSMQIDVGRGCPFACTYCSTKTFWKRQFRLRNIEDTINEIEYVQRVFAIDSFEFMHDLFTVNKKRIKEFCDEINRRGLRIKWGCDSRIDTIDLQMIDQMVDAGMNRIFFGIETGSERMQNIINKHLDLKKCDRIIQYCLKKGIEVATSFIYGFPDETEEDIDSTIQYIVKYQNWGCTVFTNLCHIMNGTELFNKYKHELVLNIDTPFNRRIIAFKSLLELISKNCDMFANFCDYPNPLRERLKYLDVFRYVLNYAHKNNYRESELQNTGLYATFIMYDHFCSSNMRILDQLVFLPSESNRIKIRQLLTNIDHKYYKRMIDNLLNYK